MTTMPSALSDFLETRSAQVDERLERFFDKRPEQPESIRKAMEYSLFAGGKRLRPALVMAAADCCGLDGGQALDAAAAVEMIHTYSLIHDDLPAMDDDDLRRGKPTSHKVFGEAFAILAGDGLLTYAFEAAARNAARLKLSGASTAALILALAKGAGCEGMVGGQVADLEGENWQTRNHGFDAAKHLEYVHLHKTAALIVASLEAGAILAQAPAGKRRALARYGMALGLAFQIADDVLDVVGDKKKLGKKGSDAQNNKLTYVSLYGLDKARGAAAAEAKKAHAALKPFGTRAAILHELADYVVARDK